MPASVPTFISSVSAVRQAVPPHASVSDGPPLLYGMFNRMVSMDVNFISSCTPGTVAVARRNDRGDPGGLPTAELKNAAPKKQTAHCLGQCAVLFGTTGLG